jgi:hypothetical protein
VWLTLYELLYTLMSVLSHDVPYFSDTEHAGQQQLLPEIIYQWSTWSVNNIIIINFNIVVSLSLSTQPHIDFGSFSIDPGLAWPGLPYSDVSTDPHGTQSYHERDPARPHDQIQSGFNGEGQGAHDSGPKPSLIDLPPEGVAGPLPARTQ